MKPFSCQEDEEPSIGTNIENALGAASNCTRQNFGQFRAANMPTNFILDQVNSASGKDVAKMRKDGTLIHDVDHVDPTAHRYLAADATLL